MAGRTLLLYHKLYDGRGFSPVRRSWLRYRMLADLVDHLGLLDPADRVEAPAALVEQLLPLHPAEYVDYVRRRDAQGVGYLDRRDTAAWRGVFERALAAVGATLDGARRIASGDAVHAFNPGGGLHHARRAQTAGFCIFNDVALAAHALRTTYGLERVAVIDIDGHHGDGTQELLYDVDVLKISLHQYDGHFFPGTGALEEVGWGRGFGYSVNLGLPRHVGDAGYLEAFELVVPEALRAYRPDVLIVNFGVDGHYADPLVRLGLTTAAYREIAGQLHDLAHELCHGRLLVCGSGGYDPEAASRCWGTMLAVLAGRRALLDALGDVERPVTSAADEARDRPRRAAERVRDEVLSLSLLSPAARIDAGLLDAGRAMT